MEKEVVNPKIQTRMKTDSSSASEQRPMGVQNFISKAGCCFCCFFAAALLHKDFWVPRLKGKAHIQSKQKHSKWWGETAETKARPWLRIAWQSPGNRGKNVERRGAGLCQIVRAMTEIRLLLTLHSTCCHKQQMAQPQAAGWDSNMQVPICPSPGAGDGQMQGKVWDPSQVEATPWKSTGQHHLMLCHNENLENNSQHYRRFSKHPHTFYQKKGLGESGIGGRSRTTPRVDWNILALEGVI